MMNMDVQTQPRTERALGLAFTAYNRYRSVFQNAFEGIFQLDPEGNYVAANPALARILGYDTAEELQADMEEENLNFYVVPERYAEFRRLLQEEGIVTGFESEVVRRDGSRIWISENAVPVRDQAGQVVGYEGFAVDITERLTASETLTQTRTDLEASREELRVAQTQATEAERLRALGAMVNGIAHDFNNSLWMILGYSELLQKLCKTKPVAPEFIEHVDIIVKASLDAVETITRLTDFQKPSEPSSALAPLNLNEVIERALNFTRPRWETESRGHGIPIEVESDLGKLGAITGSAAELCELFTHLILNSVDAMPQGGRITIQTREFAHQIEVTFADSGIGMTPEVRRRCLDPFFTTKGGRSSGVGLSVVNGTIERHGGKLLLETAPGRGAKFTFAFPVAVATPAAPREPAASSRRPLRILAVDDHPVQTELLAHALGNEGHIVSTANNGRDAIELFDSEYFDLVITDRAMPGMSGDQVAAAIKAREPLTPVIMLTGLGRISEEEEDLSEFVDLLLAKPASLKDLQAAICKVMS